MEACCCHSPILYKALPDLHAFISIIDLICGILRLVLFFSPLPNTYSGYSGNNTKQEYTSTYVNAFIVDWISSIVPTLAGLFVAFLLIVFVLKVLIHLYQNRTDKRSHSSIDDINTKQWLRKIWRNKALRRLIVLDCNCPCYKPRPKLRFQLRFGLIFVFFVLRITAIALYASDHGRNRASDIVGVTAFTITCLCLVLLLDLYHYCVWWHYTPYKDTTCCCCRSRKHVRYLPYLLVGAYREHTKFGNRPCTNNPCPKRRLEHIATFHSSTYEPQARWTDLPQPELPDPNNPNVKRKSAPTYIGFHTTTPEKAVNIVKTQFQPSSSGMLGPGLYFARSLKATIGKIGINGGQGAWFIAEINMGEVFSVEKRLIYPPPDKGNTSYNAGIHRIVSNGDWHAKYDTCYLIHGDDNLDEFCIKDPAKQIIKWVVVVEEPFDKKVKLYGMDTEFDSTKYGCI